MTKRKTNADLQREVEQLREQLSSARQMPEILTFTVAVTIDGRVVGATPSFSLQSPQHVVVVKRALMGGCRGSPTDRQGSDSTTRGGASRCRTY